MVSENRNGAEDERGEFELAVRPRIRRRSPVKQSAERPQEAVKQADCRAFAPGAEGQLLASKGSEEPRESELQRPASGEVAHQRRTPLIYEVALRAGSP